MTNKMILIGIFAFMINSAVLNAQVGINTETPRATFEVVANNSSSNVAPGIIIPVMSTDQRDAVSNPPNSLIIFNTNENCLNYYHSDSHQWLSLCGSEPPASLTIDCGGVSISGNYIKGLPCGGSNYMQIPITVNTPGNFTILGITKSNNGYSFSYSGTATVPGAMLINIPAQGTPAAIQTDTVMIKVNNLTLDDCNSAIIDVFNPAATYTITSCGQNHFGGNYVAGQSITSTHKDTVWVNVPAATFEGGQDLWSITTNTVDGLSFSGSGRFTTSGSQYVVLDAQGTPTNSKDKVFTYSTNSLDPAQQTATCQTTLRMTLNKMTVLATSSGYNAFSGGSVSRIFSNPAMFGPNASAKQPVAGFTWQTYGNLPTLLNSATPPDILIITYAEGVSDAYVNAIVSYIQKGGVVIFSTETTGSATGGGAYGMIRKLCEAYSLGSPTAGAVSASGNYTYPFLWNQIPADDPITAGPFGDLRAMGVNYWGEDAAGTQYVVNLPSQFVVYSNSQNSSNNTLVANSATMARMTTANFLFIGDGGWSNVATSSNTRVTGNPFRTTGTAPNIVPNTQIYGATGSGQLTANSIMGANIMAWAIRQAQWNGINSKNYK